MNFTIDKNSAVTIVNLIAYEAYARVKRRYMSVGIQRRPTFEEFYTECAKTLEMDILPRDAWHCGYEFVADLFDDNENNGTPCDEEARFNQDVNELLAMLYNRSY